MKKRAWAIRLLVTLMAMVIALLIALIMKGHILVNYLNVSFIISLFFLIFAGIAYTIIYGFWDVFIIGSKFLFSRRDEEKDKNFWTLSKPQTTKTESDLLREKAKKELFIFIPLTAGIIILNIAVIITFFLI